MRVVDETDFGFGWLEEARLARTSHALLVEGRVWVVDPIAWDEADDRIRALGEPAGVVQLLDRHQRDSAAFAERLGVPHLRVPDIAPPFEVVPIARSRWWREIALWWRERRVLVCADALGTVGYFRAGDEPLGVHPLLRLRPPRALRPLEPLHVLCGHGPGVHDEAAAALAEALATARRRLPRSLLGLFRATSR